MDQKVLEKLFDALQQVVVAPGIPWAVKAQMIKDHAKANPLDETTLQEFLSWFDEVEE